MPNKSHTYRYILFIYNERWYICYFLHRDVFRKAYGSQRSLWFYCCFALLFIDIVCKRRYTICGVVNCKRLASNRLAYHYSISWWIFTCLEFHWKPIHCLLLFIVNWCENSYEHFFCGQVQPQPFPSKHVLSKLMRQNGAWACTRVFGKLNHPWSCTYFSS